MVCSEDLVIPCKDGTSSCTGYVAHPINTPTDINEEGKQTDTGMGECGEPQVEERCSGLR